VKGCSPVSATGKRECNILKIKWHTMGGLYRPAEKALQYFSGSAGLNGMQRNEEENPFSGTLQCSGCNSGVLFPSFTIPLHHFTS